MSKLIDRGRWIGDYLRSIKPGQERITRIGQYGETITLFTNKKLGSNPVGVVDSITGYAIAGDNDAVVHIKGGDYQYHPERRFRLKDVSGTHFTTLTPDQIAKLGESPTAIFSMQPHIVYDRVHVHSINVAWESTRRGL